MPVVKLFARVLVRACGDDLVSQVIFALGEEARTVSGPQDVLVVRGLLRELRAELERVRRLRANIEKLSRR